MDSTELQELAQHSRLMREIGIALILASGLLAILLFITAVSQSPTPRPLVMATSTEPDAFAHVAVDAKAAIVYDLVTGETLYAKNTDAQLPLASLTKLLTVYAALVELSPDTPITIPSDVAQLEAPHAFKAGQIFSLSDLARLTLTASLNDGATAIAEATALRENRSASEMLAGAAAALNLSQTYAVNGSGLDVNTTVSGGYGSAHDLARLAGALVALSPTIAESTTQEVTKAVSEGGTSFSVKNTDPVITTIPRLLLSKTGYTDLAGGNLALVFDAGMMHPIAIILLGSSKSARFTDGSALVAATLAHFAGVASL
jgi:D-alanyl-D-alanine carboxypeptidase (penicillin-binding protein 5/6)